MAALVSVIVPVYNSSIYLERCVRSLFSQTYSEIELIFVDDCSTDGSVTILRDILARLEKSKKVTHQVICQQKNNGPNAARKVGVDAAHGEWCAFVDSDDWVEPTYVENLIGAVGSNFDLVLSGVFYDYLNIAHSSSVKIFDPVKTEIGNVSANVLSEVINFSYPVAKIFRIEFLRKNQLWVNNVSLHEDTALIINYLSEIKRIIFISNCDYHYVFHNVNSLSRRPRSYLELLEISSELFKVWDLFFENFKCITRKDMRRCLQRYGLSQLLQSAYAVYSEKRIRRNECRNVLMMIRGEKEKFRLYYKPGSWKIRCLLFIILNFPFYILHPLLKFGIRLPFSFAEFARLRR